MTINPAVSTLDPRNFIPEPPGTHWGRSLRNCLVGEIRQGRGTYAQYVRYPACPSRTADGTAIPEGVIFVEHARAATPMRAYDVPWGHAIHNARAEGTTWRERLAPLRRLDNFHPTPFVHDLRRPIAGRLLELAVNVRLIGLPLNHPESVCIFKTADHELRNVAGKVQLCHDLILKMSPPLFIESWIVRLIDHASRIEELDLPERFISRESGLQVIADIQGAATVDRDHQLQDYLRQIIADQEDAGPGLRRNPHRAVRGPAPALRNHAVVALVVLDMLNFPRATPAMYTTLLDALRRDRGIRIENLKARRAQLVAEMIQARIPEEERRELTIEYTVSPDKKHNVQGKFSERGIPARRAARLFGAE